MTTSHILVLFKLIYSKNKVFNKYLLCKLMHFYIYIYMDNPVNCKLKRSVGGIEYAKFH